MIDNTIVFVGSALVFVSYLFALFWLAMLVITSSLVELPSLRYRGALLATTEYCIIIVALMVTLMKIMGGLSSGLINVAGFSTLLAVIVTIRLYNTSILSIPQDHLQKDKIETMMRRIGIFNIGLGIILAIMYFLL